MSIKHKTIFCAAAALFTVLFLAGCKNSSETGTDGANMNGIVLESNTAVRIDPLVFSGCIIRLEKGSLVEILGKSAEKSRIARTTDYWYYVKLEDGATGWIYGQNLKQVDSKNRKQLESLVADLRDQDLSGFLKTISGKWWSTNSSGDFTNHGLELYEDNTYKSYRKGGEANPIEGEYNIDLVNSEISFPNGTSFKKNLKFVQQGLHYTLFTESENAVTRFKKIQDTPEAEEERQQPENASDKPAENGAANQPTE